MDKEKLSDDIFNLWTVEEASLSAGIFEGIKEIFELVIENCGKGEETVDYFMTILKGLESKFDEIAKLKEKELL